MILSTTSDFHIDYLPELNKVELIDSKTSASLGHACFILDAIDHKAILSKIEFQEGIAEEFKQKFVKDIIKAIRAFVGSHCRLLAIIDRSYQEALSTNGFLTESDPRIMVLLHPKPEMAELPLDTSARYLTDKETLLTHSEEISTLLKVNAYWAIDITPEEVKARIESASFVTALQIHAEDGKPKIIGFVRSISNGDIDYTSDMVIDESYQNRGYGFKLFNFLYNAHIKKHEISLLIRAGQGVGLESTPKLYKKFGYVNSNAAGLPSTLLLMHTPRVVAPASKSTHGITKAEASAGVLTAMHGLFSKIPSTASETPELEYLYSLASFRLMHNKSVPGQVIIMQDSNQLATAQFVFDRPDKKALLSNLQILPIYGYMKGLIICFLLEAIQSYTGKYTRLFALLETANIDLFLASGLMATAEPRIMMALSPSREITLPTTTLPLTIIEDKEVLKSHEEELARLMSENAYWARYCSKEELRARIDNSTHSLGLVTSIDGKNTFIGFIRMISNGRIAYASDLVILKKYQKSGLGTYLGGYLFNKYMCNNLDVAIVIRASAGTGAVATPKLYAKANFVDSDKIGLPAGIAFFSTPPVFYPTQLNTIPTPETETITASSVAPPR